MTVVSVRIIHCVLWWRGLLLAFGRWRQFDTGSATPEYVRGLVHTPRASRRGTTKIAEPCRRTDFNSMLPQHCVGMFLSLVRGPRLQPSHHITNHSVSAFPSSSSLFTSKSFPSTKLFSSKNYSFFK